MIVRPIITYGAVAWATKAAQSSVIQRLSKLQRLACVCASGAIRTCPTVALEVILELTPLHQVIKQAANHTMLLMSAESCGRGKLMSSRQMDALEESTPLVLLPKDGTTKKINFKRNFQVILGSKTEWSDSTLEKLLEDSTFQWYTDGIGAGIAGPRTKLSIPMGCFPSIFQAEVFAIGQCAEFNLSRNYRNQRWLFSVIAKRH
ncbi:uncharacterized protein LOC120782096 [Bactrocera tryoni]|uniref:uncharacterized protein LOC120782096 n=1 Tax=Bactrocera tryoni TaxID=59916 RepID=UPI001A95F227|nr:uncharacterized protein LOC120782096 [Bactrocera tryoni]